MKKIVNEYLENKNKYYSNKIIIVDLLLNKMKEIGYTEYGKLVDEKPQQIYGWVKKINKIPEYKIEKHLKLGVLNK